MKKAFKYIGALCFVIVLLSITNMTDRWNFLKPQIFNQGFTSNTGITIADGTQGNGYFLFSDANGKSSWAALNLQNYAVYGASPTVDSAITYNTSKFTLAVNSSYIITANPAFTSIGLDTLSFPTGVSGNWIVVNFNFKDSVITNIGAGSGTIALTAALTKGVTKVYLNKGGNWY